MDTASSASAGKFGTQPAPTTGTPLKTFTNILQSNLGGGTLNEPNYPQQQGLGMQQQGVGLQQQGLGQQQGFGAQQQNLGMQQPGYGAQQQGLGMQQPGYGAQQQNLGMQQPGYGAQQQNLGMQQRGYGAQQGLGQAPQQQGGLWGQGPGYDPLHHGGQQNLGQQQGLGQQARQQNVGQQQGLWQQGGQQRTAEPASSDTSGFWGRQSSQPGLGQQQQQFGQGQQYGQQQGWQNRGQQQWGGQQQYGGQPFATYERPPILQEILHPMHTEEVQPVIQRQRERTQIKQVIAPIMQRVEKPPIYVDKQLPAETRPVVYQAPNQEFNQKYTQGLPTATTQNYQPHVHRVFKQPIINETVKTNVVEEVYPVLHREIYQPQIIRETLPVIERVVEPPSLMREERAPFFLGNSGQGQGGKQFANINVQPHA